MKVRHNWSMLRQAQQQLQKLGNNFKNSVINSKAQQHSNASICLCQLCLTQAKKSKLPATKMNFNKP